MGIEGHNQRVDEIIEELKDAHQSLEMHEEELRNTEETKETKIHIKNTRKIIEEKNSLILELERQLHEANID